MTVLSDQTAVNLVEALDLLDLAFLSENDMDDAWAIYEESAKYYRMESLRSYTRYFVLLQHEESARIMIETREKLEKDRFRWMNQETAI
jgi:hypothetical protein